MTLSPALILVCFRLDRSSISIVAEDENTSSPRDLQQYTILIQKPKKSTLQSMTLPISWWRLSPPANMSATLNHGRAAGMHPAGRRWHHPRWSRQIGIRRLPVRRIPLRRRLLPKCVRGWHTNGLPPRGGPTRGDVTRRATWRRCTTGCSSAIRSLRARPTGVLRLVDVPRTTTVSPVEQGRQRRTDLYLNASHKLGTVGTSVSNKK